MKDKNKAVFHSALVIAGLVELLSTKNSLRALLIGACTGWHVVATCKHIKDMRRKHEEQ